MNKEMLEVMRYVSLKSGVKKKLIELRWTFTLESQIHTVYRYMKWINLSKYSREVSDKGNVHIYDCTSVRVYKILCTNCDLVYIGEIGKSLRIRLKHHESNCRHNSNPSEVVNHHKLGHPIDFENSCSHMTKRKIAESLISHY